MPSPSSPFFSRPLPQPLLISYDPDTEIFSVATHFEMLRTCTKADLADYIAEFALQSEREHYDRLAAIALGLSRAEELSGTPAIAGLDLGISI